MLVYKLARAFEPGDIIAHWHEGKVFVGRVTETGPRDDVVRVQRRQSSPESVAATDIIGKVVFNTRPAVPPPTRAAVTNFTLATKVFTGDIENFIEASGTVAPPDNATAKSQIHEPGQPVIIIFAIPEDYTQTVVKKVDTGEKPGEAPRSSSLPRETWWQWITRLTPFRGRSSARPACFPQPRVSYTPASLCPCVWPWRRSNGSHSFRQRRYG